MTVFSMKKISLLSTVLILTAMPQIASAQNGPPLSGLFACETVTDRNAQLSCFRTETAKLRGGGFVTAETESLALEKKRLAAERDRLAAEEKRIAALEKNIGKEKEIPKTQTLAIQSTTTYGGSGYVRFTLANGEVWRQTETGRVRLGRAQPDTLTIKKAAFGSFLARVNDKGRSFRVKQVK